uniref:Integrase catalytic domain-containing protein n=1 Tax=Nicotiana tabacum TaxID=4097 RepID=A0A1S4CAI5_TOBAC|nr:PREDICTED: uncharacterized protein LOC107816892 [Nicotiana tabacum]
MVPKTRKEYSDVDRKAVKKNFRAKKILVCGIGPDEYNRISACQTAKEIWEALQMAHEGTTQVKQSEIDMLTTAFELFRMKDDESMHDMHTRFTSIINELHSLGEIIPRNKLVRKVLSVLPSSWESKVNAITKAKDLQTLTMDELVGNLKTYEMKRKKDTDNIIKQALAAWGDSSSESEEETDARDNSMMAVEIGAKKYDSLEVQRNLKSYSPKKLMSLANVLIDAYHSLVNDKDAWTIKLGDAEQTRDDLVVCVVDLKETIDNLEKEKEALTGKINSIENERDNLMVVVVDLKETIENLSKEKNTLAEKVAATEQERDDFLVVIANLEETIEGIKSEHMPVSIEKGKEVVSEAHIKLEKELNEVKTSLCGELEKNRQLQAELEKVKTDLEKSLKWTWSSNAVTAIKYVTIPDNWLFTHCGNNGHFKENCQARVQFVQKNKVYAEKVITKKGPGATRKKRNSERKQPTVDHGQWMLEAHDWKHHRFSLTESPVGKSLSHSIENVYYVDSLKYSLLSVSQICDKRNKVEFLSKVCTVTNLVTGEVILIAKRYKNIYVADFESLQADDMRCLKVVDDDAELWHRRLGHSSFSLLNKLIQKNLVRGLPNSKFKEHRVCDACPRGKHVKSSFKPKKDVSTSKPLELLHMDLCSPMRVPSRGGKKYIFVIVDDYSRFTWTLFLRTKDETFKIFVAFVKKIQVKMEPKVACIRSDHGIEFDNAKFDEFCSENGITHNFSTPRTL